MEAVMRTLYIVAAALALIAIVVPAIWYFSARPNGDQLNDALRSLGYLPITPPSNLLSLRSLYYVDSDVKFFKTICSVKKDDLKDAIVESPPHQHACGRTPCRQVFDRNQT
jgi:hypothetical protein